MTCVSGTKKLHVNREFNDNQKEKEKETQKRSERRQDQEFERSHKMFNEGHWQSQMPKIKID